MARPPVSSVMPPGWPRPAKKPRPKPVYGLKLWVRADWSTTWQRTGGVVTPARNYSFPPLPKGHFYSVEHGACSERIVAARMEQIRGEIEQAVVAARTEALRLALEHEADALRPGRHQPRPGTRA